MRSAAGLYGCLPNLPWTLPAGRREPFTIVLVVGQTQPSRLRTRYVLRVGQSGSTRNTSVYLRVPGTLYLPGTLRITSLRAGLQGTRNPLPRRSCDPSGLTGQRPGFQGARALNTSGQPPGCSHPLGTLAPGPRETLQHTRRGLSLPSAGHVVCQVMVPRGQAFRVPGTLVVHSHARRRAETPRPPRSSTTRRRTMDHKPEIEHRSAAIEMPVALQVARKPSSTEHPLAG